jgi:hypothetical protein
MGAHNRSRTLIFGSRACGISLPALRIPCRTIARVELADRKVRASILC